MGRGEMAHWPDYHCPPSGYHDHRAYPPGDFHGHGDHYHEDHYRDHYHGEILPPQPPPPHLHHPNPPPPPRPVPRPMPVAAPRSGSPVTAPIPVPVPVPKPVPAPVPAPVPVAAPHPHPAPVPVPTPAYAPLETKAERRQRKKEERRLTETKEERRARKERKEKRSRRSSDSTERCRRKKKIMVKAAREGEDIPRPTNTNGRSIQVHNICAECTLISLKEQFRRFGIITNIKLLPDEFSKGHKGIAEIEYEEAAQADKALKLMQGFNLGGRQLHLAKTADPNLPNGSEADIGGSVCRMEDLSVISMPGHRVDLMKRLMRNGDSDLTPPTGPTPIPIPSTKLPATAPLPSRCIVLRNMVLRPEDLDEEVGKELRDECCKYGTVERICIYDVNNPMTQSSEVLFYVLFHSLRSSESALGKLNGRKFANRRVTVAFCSLEEFNQVMNES